MSLTGHITFGINIFPYNGNFQSTTNIPLLLDISDMLQFLFLSETLTVSIYWLKLDVLHINFQRIYCHFALSFLVMVRGVKLILASLIEYHDLSKPVVSVELLVALVTHHATPPSNWEMSKTLKCLESGSLYNREKKTDTIDKLKLTLTDKLKLRNGANINPF